MLKASALYIVIIIALVIGLLCSSLIVAAYFYKAEYQRKFRRDRLANNVSSGVNILLASGDSLYAHEKTFDLFGNATDSVSLQRIPWGIYDVGISKAFIQHDTLYKVFSLANAIDSTKWAALYLADQEGPLDVSGKTSIKGNTFLPKAGINKAFINNKAYEGDERLVVGERNISQSKIPVLGQERLLWLDSYLSEKKHVKADRLFTTFDSLRNSFKASTRLFSFGKNTHTITKVNLIGNIILFSDSTLTIDSSAKLDNILIFAKSIIVKPGFHGRCQLFATDSISVGRNCYFDYPSCLGVVDLRLDKRDVFTQIKVDDNTIFNGVIFDFQQRDERIKPLMVLGKNVKITGQVYSQGIFKYQDSFKINGSIFTRLFVFQNTFNMVENTLFDSKIDSKALSPYYLSSDLMPVAKKEKKVLQWLERN